MLQDFRRRTTPDTGAARLVALRAAMAEAGVDAFLVPRADAHQGENVAPRDERLAWLSGFTGSAGQAVVTADRAVVFVDGRYRLQVRGQVDTDRFEIRRIPEDKPADWLAEALPRGGRLGFDPWLHTAKEVEELAEALGRGRSGWCGWRTWSTGPGPTSRRRRRGRWWRIPWRWPGASSAEKRGEIAKGLVARDLAAAVLTLPEFDRLAPQRARRGHRPHPGGARLRHPRRRRAGRSLHRPGQGGRRRPRPPRAGGAGGAAGGLRAGARRAQGAGGGGQGERAGLGVGPHRRQGRGARWSGSATPASCRRRSRRRRKSRERGRRICATGWRWRSSSPGST